MKGDKRLFAGWGKLFFFKLFLLAAAAVALTTGLSGCDTQATARSGSPKTARFQMTTRAVVKDIPHGAKVLDLWMPYPKNTANQRISDIHVKSPHPVEVNYEKKYGNAVLHARVEKPKKDFEVAVKFNVVRTESLNDLKKKEAKFDNPGDFKAYLQYDKVGALTPLLKGLSDKLTRGKKGNVAKAKAIYDYMIKTYVYDYDSKSLPTIRGDLSEYCRTKKGRCTELSTLFGTLARAQGIPVKYTSGYVLRNHDSGEVGGHCCFVEFWAPGMGWIPVDLATAKKFPQDSDYYFGNVEEWRVELVNGRDIVLEPPQKGSPINAWIDPYAEIDGKPFTVGKRVSWVKKQGD